MPIMVPGDEESKKAREISVFCECAYLTANVATGKPLVWLAPAILPVDTDERQ
jgi:hypothetical protein